MFFEPLQNLEPVKIDGQTLVSYLPPIPQTGLDIKEASKKYLEKSRASLKELHEKNIPSSDLVLLHSRMLDHLVIFLFNEVNNEVKAKLQFTGKQASLLALGGYGRQEMNLFSDVDLCFIYSEKRGAYIENLTEKLLKILWDIGLEVGHATRTVAECKKLFVEDTTIMTSLLDARHLCGDSGAISELSAEIKKLLKSSSLKKKLVTAKLKEREARIQKFGGSVFVLEPNVKEASGALRDLHTIAWVSKILGKPSTLKGLMDEKYFDEEEYKSLKFAKNFLLRIRNDLHFAVKRKSDAMSFDRQIELATHMGFVDSENGILAVEQFMQAYYNVAYAVSTLTEKFIREITSGRGFRKLLHKIKSKSLDESFCILNGQIAIKNPHVFDKDPLNLLRIFKHVQEKGLPLHAETSDHMRVFSSKVDENFRRNKEAARLFRERINEYKNLGLVLQAMHDVHFLDEWMPEFKKLRCRVQHDIYHIYTIDTHSIFAVNELSKLAAGEYDKNFPLYKKILPQVKRPELLTLGVFFHDIGKGEGGNHSVKGAEIANRITERLGYSDEDRKVIEFLVISHLMMPHLSQRRDLEDQDLIINFATSMGNMDHLNMLFLLTWADIRAVGPEAWTDWKGSLLEKMYLKTKEVIESGEFSKEKTQERIARVKEGFISQISDKNLREQFLSFLEAMPPRYFFAMNGESVRRHFYLRQKNIEEKKNVGFTSWPFDHHHELLIETLNAPQVFALITAVMLYHAVNIIQADLFSSRDGYITVVLMVTDAHGKKIDKLTLFDEIRKTLEEVLLGRVKVDSLLEKRKIPDYMAKKPVQMAQSKVVVDNDVSAYHTVIDVYAHDRLGLLYDITRTLNENGLYVEVSKISTKVEQVTDAFYVKDIFGQKITSRDKLNNIKQALEKIIS